MADEPRFEALLTDLGFETVNTEWPYRMKL
jgi:hypothetical protein